MRKQISAKLNDLMKKPLFLIIIALLLIIYILFFFTNIFVYMLLLIFSGIIQYKLNNRMPKINIGHIFFLAFIINWHDGLAGEILFILLAGFLPEFLGGYLEPKTFIAYPLMILIISIPSYLWNSNLVVVGVITSIVYYGFLIILNSITKEPLHEVFLEIVLPLILSICYFIYFGNSLYDFLGMIL